MVDMLNIDFGWDDEVQLSDVDEMPPEEADDAAVDADTYDDGIVLLMVDENVGDGSWHQVSTPSRVTLECRDERVLDRSTPNCVEGAKDTVWRMWRTKMRAWMTAVDLRYRAMLGTMFPEVEKRMNFISMATSSTTVRKGS